MRGLVASFWVVLLGFVLATGCSTGTNLANGLAACASDADCPGAYHCAIDHTCWQDGSNPASVLSGDAGAACPGAQVQCGTECVDPRSSREHCGATQGCGNAGAGTAGVACDSGLVCNAGTCSISCPGAQVNCNGACVDPKSDPQHCGATLGCGAEAGGGDAGVACTSGTVCNDGACAASCSTALTNCGGACINAMTDPAHCGGCSTTCALDHVAANVCSAGACVVASCAAGYGDCDGIAANGCETATTATDVNNCGGCGIHCAYANAGATCNAGTCALGACAPGFADCDGNPANGCEVNTKTDLTHCGTCTKVCNDGEVCSLGGCAASCGAGLTNCSGSCVDLTTDLQHCGSCTGACALAQVATNACASSACVVGACATGFGNCDGNAANGCETATRSSDVNNCGGCGIRCSYANAAASCTTGTCGMGICAAGFANCDGSAINGCEVNTKSDNGNCGACGAVCPDGKVCSAGVCTTTCGTGFTNCSGSCADLTTDAKHCGTCATVCALPNTSVNACGNGCVVGACAPGYGNCDGNAANGCETATLSTDVNNCGGCGVKCNFPNAGSSCAGGTCAMGPCAPGFADCDGNAANGCEVDTRSDNGNCAACATTCPGGKVCSGGMCGTTCGVGLTNCSGACVDLTSSPAHCGACPTACPAATNGNAVCAGSTCGFTCSAAFKDCNGAPGDGCEVNSASDPNNCGGCGRACGGSNPCLNGVCGCATTYCSTGKDGPLVVGTSTVFSPAATHLAAGAAATATNINVVNAAGFAVGDLVLIVNVRSSGGNHGLWELRSINAIVASALTLSAGLTNGYPEPASTIVQRVPQYTSANINATLGPAAWNPGTLFGGIVAFAATGNVTIGAGGSINVAGLGYAGGVADTVDAFNPYWKVPGESIHGSRADGTVNSANDGGGGGGFHRAFCEGAGAGGGGYGTAGGQGGTGYTLCSGSPMPGGFGGNVYGSPDMSRIYLGSGGGGGGYSNSPPLANGGAGGGMVMVFAGGTVTINGSIDARGANGQNEMGDYGAGGGGSGGSVYLRGTSYTGLGNALVAGGAGGLTNNPVHTQVGGAGGAGRLVPAGGTYTITTASPLVNLASGGGCGGQGEYQNDCAQAFGFSWNDTGVGSLSSMSVSFTMQGSCAAAGTVHAVTLNGTLVGSVTTNGPTCSCTNLQPFTMTPFTLAPYVVGGTNTLRISSNVCEGINNMGGTLATVNVRY